MNEDVLRYRHAGSDAESLVHRSAAMIKRSRHALAATEGATWDRLMEAWRRKDAAPQTAE